VRRHSIAAASEMVGIMMSRPHTSAGSTERQSFWTAICDSYSSPWLPASSSTPRPCFSPCTTQMGSILLLHAPLSSLADQIRFPKNFVPGSVSPSRRGIGCDGSEPTMAVTPVVCSFSQATRSSEVAVPLHGDVAE